MATHVMIKVHMNGVNKSSVINDAQLREMEDEIHDQYGDGIFIDGKCVKQGYLSGEQVRNWSKRIANGEVKMPNHFTVGVYNNNQYKTNVVRHEDLESHIEYNKTWRFGRALFVDGECVNKGYLSDERIAEWTEKISKMKPDLSKSTEPYQ